MSTNEQRRENSLTTKKTTTDLIADIRSTATALLGEVYDFDADNVQPLLEQLRDTLAKARRQGVFESSIARVLEEARQSGPEVIGTWDEILEQITVYVWLEDPDGTRVRGNTVVVDRIIWEYEDEESVLNDTVQELRDDLEVGWEIL